jgi:hypothetical protein
MGATVSSLVCLSLSSAYIASDLYASIPSWRHPSTNSTIHGSYHGAYGFVSSSAAISHEMEAFGS